MLQQLQLNNFSIHYSLPNNLNIQQHDREYLQCLSERTIRVFEHTENNQPTLTCIIEYSNSYDLISFLRDTQLSFIRIYIGGRGLSATVEQHDYTLRMRPIEEAIVLDRTSSENRHFTVIFDILKKQTIRKYPNKY